MKRIIFIFVSLILVATIVHPISVQSAPSHQQTALASDDFGYSIAEAAVTWISADNILGASGNTTWGPYNLGFTFKYYGRAYTSIYISGNGLVSLGSDPNLNTPIDTYLPKTIYPNNLIAPFWIALKSGTVLYKAGGTEPNRYFVVEYNNVRLVNGDSSEPVWFEVILYENNQIAWSYYKLPSVKNCHTGIEDESGWYGLSLDCTYLHTRDLNSYLTTYPEAAPRVKLTPPVQSAFGSPGATLSFPLTILNAGDQGSDRFDLTVTSPWPVTLYQSNGTTPLTDTDASTKVDTGPLAQGTGLDIVAKVSVPALAGVGAHAQINLEARSKLNSGILKNATLQAAVPAPFAQVFRDDIDKAMQLERIEPGQRVAQKVSADGENGRQMAVAEMADGDLVYAWATNRRNSNNKPVSEIKYTLRDRNGGLVKAVTPLTDYSSASDYVTDSDIALAITPDQHIGLLWKTERWNYNNFTYNPNLFFAVLNADGSVAYPPSNLTGFTTWYGWNASNSIGLNTPALTATSDNRFILAWNRFTFVSYSQHINDLYLASRQSSGEAVGAILQLTHDSDSQTDGFMSPTLTGLGSAQALLAWVNAADGDVHYATFNSALTIVKADTNLSGDGLGLRDTDPRAVRLPNGKVITAWLAGGNIKYAVLDTGYNRVGSPSALSNPLARNGNHALSLTSDAANHAILTWADYDSSLYYVPYRPHLYYALLNHDGSLLTPTMFLHSSLYNLETSFLGYGSTTHASPNPDLAVEAPGFLGGAANANLSLPIRLWNLGTVGASGITLTAVLDASLTYVSATPAPTTITGGGHNLTWNLANLAGGASTPLTLVVRLPTGAPLGTRYPVALTADSIEEDANLGNNAKNVELVISKQVFLPLAKK